jgi:hypothetical protein
MISIQLDGIARVDTIYTGGAFVQIRMIEHGAGRRDPGPGEVKMLLSKDEFIALFLELKATAEVIVAEELAHVRKEEDR